MYRKFSYRQHLQNVAGKLYNSKQTTRSLFSWPYISIHFSFPGGCPHYSFSLSGLRIEDTNRMASNLLLFSIQHHQQLNDEAQNNGKKMNSLVNIFNFCESRQHWQVSHVQRNLLRISETSASRRPPSTRSKGRWLATRHRSASRSSTITIKVSKCRGDKQVWHQQQWMSQTTMCSF